METIKLIHENGQPYGIRNNRRYLIYFPKVTKWPKQERRYVKEIRESFALANMIFDFLRLYSDKMYNAQESIAEYHEETEKGMDVNLLLVLSHRSTNALIEYNERQKVEEDKLIYVSDVVRAIRENSVTFEMSGRERGKIYFKAIYNIRNIGVKSHDEIMEYVYPFL